MKTHSPWGVLEELRMRATDNSNTYIFLTLLVWLLILVFSPDLTA